MKPSFVAYIDEAGDEGFVFKPDGRGSTRWFVLSALVVRYEQRLELVKLTAEARKVLGKPPRYPLHFRELRHEQRLPLARMIGQAPVITVHVLVHKPSIPEPENFRQAYSLYRYACRLLLERVSWLCKSGGAKTNPADAGKVDLIFSNRSAMSYEDLRRYLRLLKTDPTVRIEWDVFDIEAIRAINHEQLAGLQLADAVATGVFYAVNPSAYGETEARYLDLLSKTLYRYKQKVSGYGLKLWAADTDSQAAFEQLIQRL